MEMIITSALVLSGLVNLYLINKIRLLIENEAYLKFNLSVSRLIKENIESSSKEIGEYLKKVIDKKTQEIYSLKKEKKKIANKLYKQISYYKKWYYGLQILTNNKHKKQLIQLRSHSLSVLEDIKCLNINK